MTKIDIPPHGFVRLVDSMGNDDSIVRAARVSYADAAPKRTDERLIKYLIDHRHTSPFEHVTFTFHVKCPIFIARQWMRHRTWSYNEISGRYSELKEEFWWPAQWRSQDAVNKQGSGTTLNDIGQKYASSVADRAYEDCWNAYQNLLDAGVSKEQARAVLPLSTYTEFYGTVNLHNLWKFADLRTERHAQDVMQEYARALVELARPVAPISFAMRYSVS